MMIRSLRRCGNSTETSENSWHPMGRRRRFVFVALGLLFFYLTFMLELYDIAMKVGNRRVGGARSPESGEATTTFSTTPSGASEVEFADSTLDGPLPAAFLATLRNYSIVPQADVKVVLVVTYYRAGSSFLGELLSQGPRTFFHFEPLMLFTVSGRIRPGRERHAFQLIEELLRCRMENVPLYTAWLENNGYHKFNRFLTEVCEGGESCSSPSHLSALCSRSTSQVFKFTRLYIRQVAAWLKRNPDIARSVRVLHLVRDPRAIYSSRRGLKWCTSNANCDKASALCDQMRLDLEAFDELKTLLPADRVHRLRFEDLALNAVNETEQLYTRLGLDYTSSVVEYLGNHTKATRKDMKNDHSTNRNTRDIPARWKTKLSRNITGVIEETCSDVLNTLGYEFIVHGVAKGRTQIP